MTAPTLDEETTGDIRPVPAQRRPTIDNRRPRPTDDITALVDQAQNGDAEAFGRIYDRYLDTVYRFIYYRTGNKSLTEDLTQDTFLRALDRIGSFEWMGRDLAAWLVTIARNLVADHFKSGRYRLQLLVEDAYGSAGDRRQRHAPGADELATDYIRNAELLTAVMDLNPEQRECIVLRFILGFSVAETAQAMGKNEGAIKALQLRAVRTLGSRLARAGFVR